MAKLFCSQNDGDAYLSPVFTLQQRFKRLAWLLIQGSLYRWSPRPFFGWRSWLLRRFGAKVGRNCFFYPKATVWAPWLLTAADVVTVGDGVEIYNPGGVELGHHSIVSQGAFLCGASHDFNSERFPMTWKKIRLGPYAWVCSRAVVMPGVTVGAGAVLGAAAVTSKDLETMGVYAGNPARRVSTRTAELDLHG